ncbi:MAG: fimbrillin family protein, partial [Muribaculaceae bacterium]|nr:fimbrillin family protein [Muribaculaceae bacterium]
MIRNNILSCFGIALSVIVSSGCSEEAPANGDCTDTSKREMRFSFSLSQDTKASETSFENGDRVGLFVTDAGTPLQPSGNIVNNELFTCTGLSWESSRRLYWNDGLHDAYAYYPYSENAASVTDYPFSISTDQRETGSPDELKGLEASDFLFASANDIRASSDPIDMTFRHILSKLTVRLIKGEDFEGNIPENATVYIHNTVPSATVDLSAGIATKTAKGKAETVI